MSTVRMTVCSFTVFHAMDVVRWSSMVPQGQCLLAPLILVILDTSKFYDYLVKIIFKLHEQIPPDALSGHRERFGGIFRKMKAFYEEATNLQYFKYLVSVPKLPSLAPNFLQASDLDTYQSPHAYLHNDNVSESDTPPDGRSIDESLVDISEPQEAQVEQQAPSTDPRDLLIDTLRRDVEDARFNNERLMNEARSRIEQYENRLLQMKHENDHYKQSVDEMKEELERVRAANVESERHAVDEARLQDIERKALSSEQNFQKMKSAYANLRQEHIEALTKLSNAQKDLATSESERMNKEEAVRNLERKMVDIEKDKLVVEKKMLSAEGNVDDLQGQLAKCQIDIENLTKTIDDMKEAATNEINNLNAEKQSLQRQVTEMDLAQEQLKEQACATANSVDDLHAKLSEMTTQNALLNQTITDLKEASSKEIGEINAKNKMLQMQIAEMDLERQQLNERACTTANSVDDLQAKLSNMTAQNASLNQTIGTLKETSSKELEESRSKSALLQMQIDELARERMQLKEQACTAANNLNRLQTELSNMTTQNQLLNQV
ncbi:unnamed protein product [Anisakis simplex]|uniref:Huntingtin interacting protein 1 (inferred by orthology to a D. melanogaster protein) n=1 Tax=Anisakis simplex TaxID=6269 RepID=A0A0M3KC41_ANISI|nr:unnamed protein product [Anisakis simplex]